MRSDRKDMLTPIGILFGTRPEYLKCKPLFSAFESEGIEFRILHVKQHKDLEIEESIHPSYRSISLDFPLGVSRLNELASNLPKQLEPAIQECSSILVQGDTATAFFGCLTAFHMKRKIFHLEAGLRTYDLANPFPEEAYRSMISRLATYHLCPDEQAANNLRKEGIHSNLFVVGNTILDLVKSYGFEPRIGNRVLITVHRRENWDAMIDIAKAIRTLALANPQLDFDWVLHPNPSISTQVSEYFQLSSTPKNICLLPPLTHKDLAEKIYDSYCILTDSGGIQEEGSFAGKFLFVLRKTTERSAIPSTYVQIVEDPKNLPDLFSARKSTLLQSCKAYGSGNSSQLIVLLLRNLLSEKILA